MKTKAIYFLTLLILSGCAGSLKIQYDGINANLPAFSENITIAIWDQREQVLDGSRKPDFVGYMRSGAGIAYPIGTASGKPIVDDISSSIASSLEKQGCTTSIITTSPTEDEHAILDNFAKNGSGKLFLMKCSEYHTDGYGIQNLNYDLLVKIFASDGQLLKEKSFQGDRNLGGSVAWGAGKYKEYMPEGLKALLEEIFNDPEISSGLSQ